MKAELAPLLAELSRAGQAPHAEELHELWEAALFFTADKEAGAVKLVEEHLVWRRRSPYPGVADVDHIPAAMLHRELSCGLVYVRGADREGRSVIVFNVNKHTTSSPWYDKKRMLCAVVFVIEQALYESRHNRQFVLLCNLRGFGMRNFDQYLIGRAFRIIFHNYPKTMHACLLANAPVVFNAAWAILRTWIPPALADAFHFVDDSGVTQFVPQPPAEENDPIRIAPYMGLMVGHLRHARGASSSVNPALTPPALPSALPSAPASSLPSPLPSASPSAPRDPTPPPSVPNPASAKSHSPSLPSPSLGPVAKAPPPEPNLAPSQLSATTAASAHASVPASLATPTPTPLAQPPPPPPPKPRSPDESEPSAPVATAGCEGGGESRAVAVEYVETLLTRAHRDAIPEADVKQAISFFEEAKKANSGGDFKAACSYFETSFRLNPKLTTLISTANMCARAPHSPSAAPRQPSQSMLSQAPQAAESSHRQRDLHASAQERLRAGAREAGRAAQACHL